jgi:putative transposase
MGNISSVNDTHWNIGKQRADIIRPLAKQRECSIESVLRAAQTLQLSERYVYQLIRNCRASQGTLTSLIPKKSDGGKGKTRLSKSQESLIHEIIENFYLTPQKLKPAYIVEEVRKQCSEKGIDVPSEATIRRRLCNISKTQLKVRGEDHTQINPIIGCFPEVDYPLSVVQIDHTLVDIIIVDPIDRLPIGRPYLTLAIDVYSRCIAGFVLSLEAPSAVSVGLCLTHIAMKKDSWLAMHDIDASWPIHGKPLAIYVDNGSDFHSAALTRGCEQHGIRIEYRPLGQPHYGGITWDNIL